MPKKISPLLGDPLGVEPPSTTSSSKKSRTVVEACGVLILMGGLLAMVFNILFIYFGMQSGWYYFKDSLGTELKVDMTMHDTIKVRGAINVVFV